MSEHRGAPPFGEIGIPINETSGLERGLRAWPVLLARSDGIQEEGLVLKRFSKGDVRLVKRQEAKGVVGADGKKQGIHERIDASVRRAVRLGLGKMRRLA